MLRKSKAYAYLFTTETCSCFWLDISFAGRRRVFILEESLAEFLKNQTHAFILAEEIQENFPTALSTFSMECRIEPLFVIDETL